MTEQRSGAGITEAVAKKVRELHKRYPRLGHHGLLEALRSEGYNVAPEDLKQFMKANRIEPETRWKPLKFRGVSRYFVGPDPTRGGRMKGTFEDD